MVTMRIRVVKDVRLEMMSITVCTDAAESHIMVSGDFRCQAEGRTRHDGVIASFLVLRKHHKVVSSILVPERRRSVVSSGKALVGRFVLV